MYLKQYLQKYKEDIRLRTRVRQFGGDGTAERIALLGDTLIKYTLLEYLDVTGKSYEIGDLTHKLSAALSNKQFGKLGRFLIPEVISQEEWEQLGEHNKGTVIEACIGAIYIQEGKVITETFRQCIQELLDCCLLAGRNPYSVLMEYLQSKGINNPADYINTTQHCETAEFQSSIKLLDGSIIEGAFSSNKSGAEHNLAIKALEAIGNEELKSIGIDIEQVNLEPIPAKSISLSSIPSSTEELLQFKLFVLDRDTHQIKKRTGESDLEYIKRKVEKDPFFAIFLLQRLMENAFTTTVWQAKSDLLCFVLICVEKDGEKFFEIGTGKSLTKAKNDAALKIMRSRFFCGVFSSIWGNSVLGDEIE